MSSSVDQKSSDGWDCPCWETLLRVDELRFAVVSSAHLRLHTLTFVHLHLHTLTSADLPLYLHAPTHLHIYITPAHPHCPSHPPSLSLFLHIFSLNILDLISSQLLTQ